MKMTAHKITNCLWFDTLAEEAAKFYVSIFGDAKSEELPAMEMWGRRPTARSRDRS